MKTLSTEEKNEIIDILTPVFAYMDPGFAALVLGNMLKAYMNAPSWDMEGSSRRANAINVVGSLVRLLSDLNEYYSIEED